MFISFSKLFQMDPMESHRPRSDSLHPEYFEPNFERRDSFKAQGMELVKLLRVITVNLSNATTFKIQLF